MRYDALLVMVGLLFSASPASAQISIGIGLPSVSIGINLPSYPDSWWCRTIPSTTPREGT